VIGEFSSDSGFALVVPTYFVCAGILLYTGIVAAILGMYRGRAPLNLSFAATCFFSALMSLSYASYYLAASVHGGVEAMRWANVGSAGFVYALFLFMGVYTDAARMKRVYAAAGALAVAFIAASLLLPQGTRFAHVESYGWTQMPWGESLFRLHGTMSAWNVALRVLAALMCAWAMLRLFAMHRRGRRRDALVLALYLLVLLATSVQGGLVDRGLTSGFYGIPLALTGLALLMSVNLGIRMREQNAELLKTTMELRRENERRRQAEAQIRERAFTDLLTGLPNRAFAQDRLANLIELGAPGAYGAVLLCDLDHFKVINDGLSHELGDQLLRRVGERLREAARGQASVARMDGNAFMLVPEGLDPGEAQAREHAEALAGEVTRALAQPIELGEHSIEVTASVGFATFAAHASTANEVIGQVDLALQRAKRRGRSTIQAYEPSFRQQAEGRFHIIEGLRRAIGTAELALHFQPQFESDGRMIGAEALMRWTSPSLGVVPPSTFIPVAEESGLIHALGEWSVRAGCDALARWKREGGLFAGLHLSVNVSPWQLARPEFVDRLSDIVEASDIDPEQLTLEITESAVLFDVADTVAKLRRIRPLGVRIALDDFGTGYSSLALIKDLPLDEIKIDQSFVRALDEGANKHLIRVVVAIGAELGMHVIAEGVETAVERDILASLGCTSLQGYLFARPMPQAQFETRLRARRADTLAKSLSI